MTVPLGLLYPADSVASFWSKPDDQTVQVLRRDECEIWLLGTSHVSEASARLVASAVETLDPDLLAIEYDKKRLGFEDSDLLNLVPTPHTTLVGARRLETISDSMEEVVNDVVSSMWRSYEDAGIASGEEFYTALELSLKRNIPVLLADQDIDLTNRRRAQASVIDIINFMTRNETTTLSPNDFRDPNIVFSRASTRIENHELKTKFPEFFNAVVDERDAVMTANILDTLSSPKTYHRVLCVVGMAHEDGIARRLRHAGFRDDLLATAIGVPRDLR